MKKTFYSKGSDFLEYEYIYLYYMSVLKKSLRRALHYPSTTPPLPLHYPSTVRTVGVYLVKIIFSQKFGKKNHPNDLSYSIIDISDVKLKIWIKKIYKKIFLKKSFWFLNCPLHFPSTTPPLPLHWYLHWDLQFPSTSPPRPLHNPSTSPPL